MPRWMSVAAMVAASALVAPVSTHYIAKDPAAAVTQGRQLPAASASGDAGAAKAATPSMLQTLRNNERDARMEGRQDIADLICGYTHEPRNDATQSCPSDAIRQAEIILATVPDPVHTRLALRFDREIDVMEEELQQLGWMYDRSWLPWDSTTRKAPDRWEARALDSHMQNALESLPGVLLFRRRNDAAAKRGKNPAGDLLVVLLVGEDPTGGINSEQFDQALTYWQQPETLVNVQPGQPSAGTPAPMPPRLTILGPSFSGSLPSLDTALRQRLTPWPTGDFTLRIASGTVSDGEALSKLGSRYRQAHPTTQIESFFPASRDLSYGLACFLQQHQAGLKIADLREKESGFGAIPSRVAKESCQQKNTHTAPIDSFHYPREISQLRRAYEQNGIVGFSDSATTPRNQLQLSTGQVDRGSDSVTMFGGPIDAVALEADLAALTRELAEDKYAVVLVSGTDVMDEIFVARYLSQHAPNITVVIEDSDQLFLHEGQDASLNNVYVASPWPLLWRNGRWTAPAGGTHDTNMRFSSAGNQGVATALHALLCASSVTTACDPKSYQEYRSPFEGTVAGGTVPGSPPAWLSLVEHGDFLPVALMDLSAADAGKNAESYNLPAVNGASNAAGVDESTGFTVKVLATVIIGLLLWHGWSCYTCRLDRSTAWTYALAEQEHHRIRLLVKSSLSLVGAFALAVLFIPASGGMRLQTHLFQDYLVLGQVAAVLISTLSIRKLVSFENLKHSRVAAGGVGGVLVILLGLTDYCLWPLLAPHGSGSEHLFFLYRVASPFSGGSPAMPLLLMTAAAALFLHGVFSRLAFFGHRIPKLPDGFDYVRCPSNESAKPLTSLLANVGDRRRWKSAGACVVVMVMLLGISEQHRMLSLAKGPFDGLMTVLLVIVGAIILQNLFIAYLAWRYLRHKILIPLKQSPLRWGFTWIKDFSWQRIWRSSKTLSSTQVFDYLFRLLQASSRRPGSGTSAQYYEKICKLYEAAQRGAQPHAFTDGVEDIQRKMRDEAEDRLWTLQSAWQKDSGPLTGNKEVNRGVHLLEDLGAAEGTEREDILKRMGSEEFVALIYVGYISMVLIQIRQRIFTAASLYILLLWSLTNYPWMYRHTLLLLLVAFFLVLAMVTLFIYSGMHRDDILSRTTETESGKLDGGFVPRVLAVLGVPLLTLVASQFPEVSSFVFSWLEPSLSKLP